MDIGIDEALENLEFHNIQVGILCKTIFHLLIIVGVREYFFYYFIRIFVQCYILCIVYRYYNFFFFKPFKLLAAVKTKSVHFLFPYLIGFSLFLVIA